MNVQTECISINGIALVSLLLRNLWGLSLDKTRVCQISFLLSLSTMCVIWWAKWLLPHNVNWIRSVFFNTFYNILLRFQLMWKWSYLWHWEPPEGARYPQSATGSSPFLKASKEVLVLHPEDWYPPPHTHTQKQRTHSFIGFQFCCINAFCCMSASPVITITSLAYRTIYGPQSFLLPSILLIIFALYCCWKGCNWITVLQ